MKSRNIHFDRIRFIAVLAVVATHSAQKAQLNSEWLQYILHYCEVGVIVFFVLSANLIFRLCDKEDFSYKIYIYKRMLRLFPLYLSFIIIYFPFVYLKAAYDLNGEALKYSFELIFMNILLINSFHENANYVVPGGWSISVEWVFYLLAPFMLSLSRSLLTIENVFKLLLMYYLCLVVVVYTSQNYTLNGFGPLYVSPLFQIPLLFIVVSLFNIKTSVETGILSLISGLVISFTFHSPLVETEIDAIIYCASLVLGIQIFISSLDAGKVAVGLVNVVVSKIAQLSYEIYLIHFIILNIISRGFSFFWEVEFIGFIGFISIFVLTILSSVCVSIYVVRPYSIWLTNVVSFKS
jgi:peptidoglycan/LPS O-acetylase OafA/YrhL